jgi:hypothetical protein
LRAVDDLVTGREWRRGGNPPFPGCLLAKPMN